MDRSTSSKPRKVRKHQFDRAKHQRSKDLQARLSSQLAGKYGTRSMAIRKGDKVQVMRGDFASHEDEVTDVDPDRGFVYVKDATQEKADGTKSFVPLRASNLRLTSLNLDDERRQKVLQRRGMP